MTLSPSTCPNAIYPASFCDANGDGFGDIPGIISKLDYLKALGVDVVWLCPVYKSPQVDMGYDISDYRSIHRPYGSMNDVEDLIDGLHLRGMKLIMDLVVNHTSDQHEWFQESRSSKGNLKRDWYVWRKPRIDDQGSRHPPNNWASIFGGSAWSYDEHTGEYYLRLFAKEQPDLNWENPAVVREVHDVMDFWLSKGVDGFRMDVINLISKTPGYPDAPITIPHHEFQPAHILDKYDAFSVGEMPWVKDERDVIRAVAADRMELNMIFQMDIVDLDFGVDGKFSPKPWTLPSLKAIVEKWQTYMKYAATMLATFIGLQAGTLFIYQGQELGMANLPKSWPIEEYKDVETQTLYQLALAKVSGDQVATQQLLGEVHLKARDHSRSPVQWNSSANSGFTTGVPWMRVNNDYVDCNAEQQASDPTSVLSYWRQIFKIRKLYVDTVVYGSFDMIDREHPAIVCYKRAGEAGRVTVVANFTDHEQSWLPPHDLVSCLKNGIPILANYGRPGHLSGDSLLLRPFEAFVLLERQTMIQPDMSHPNSLLEQKAGFLPQVTAVNVQSL
ncbi:glycoside hydrolase family 13 protein [Purpureocillium lavendulum]|uniref:Glycoside hydrolase family 13 protein n=1 Tax=Purpureocillium lavendulum TaxID=1247861 RepID=A0AB34FQX3_9HYPO|nr:glycoside hydrolase family 13 protein [Purpureocillium lavendulum]